MKTNALISLIALALLFSACSNKTEIIKTEVILLPQEDGKVGKIVVADAGKEVVLDQAWQKVDTGNLDKKEILSKEIVESRYSSLLKSMPKTMKNYHLYFNFDSSDLSKESTNILREVIKEIKSKTVLQVDIIGYSDTAGDKVYNKILSMKRAKNVIKLLKSEGIDENIISLYYYGEANPLVKTADNVAEQENRRVEITIK